MLKGLGELWLIIADEKCTLRPPPLSLSSQPQRKSLVAFDSTVLTEAPLWGGWAGEGGAQSTPWGHTRGGRPRYSSNHCTNTRAM